MEFFMDMELVPGEGGNGPKGGVLTGFLILEATENDKPVCSRKYTVEYAMVPSGRRWSQRFLVKDGSEEVFAHEGLTGDKNLMEKLGREVWVKLCIFSIIFSDCVRQKGALKGPLVLDNPPPDAIDFLFRLCRGPTH
ncbi:MAG: hypothetical protein A3J06_04645 [Candidatus Moranbacteria bacterium RIFCSPLOWO2_02_FULL_48_19]|nr:MAG: hypothetical protein A3J06_04645 [Candidatus Moranbacteria bacterium RIFCSPLOWO2_02_FULL_48_19]